jgi:3-methyladenine DNA glycosylase AlkD
VGRQVSSSRCLGEWAARFPTEAKPIIERYIASSNFWLNRSAIIHQLNYASKTNTEVLTAAILPHLSSKEFFIQKAIGWALRQYARTAPAWVQDFVATYPLAALSRREALKHLTEAD